jgi:YgiT-type zinc finger domain-containing protein
MICVVCKIGETQPGETTLLLERADSLIIIKEVPVHICENCGEKYFDAHITREVLQKAEEAVQKGAELEVLRMVA